MPEENDAAGKEHVKDKRSRLIHQSCSGPSYNIRCYRNRHEASINYKMSNQSKSEILLVGCGGVGTMCAYNLEVGSQAIVTAVLRSNYDAVSKNGFCITSIEHGNVTGWRPSKSDKTSPCFICFSSRLISLLLLIDQHHLQLPVRSQHKMAHLISLWLQRRISPISHRRWQK